MLFKKIAIISLVISFCLFFAYPAFALPALLPSCISDGNCTLNDVGQVFGNLARIILGVTGSFALLFFIYGGFILLTSAGSANQVSKGKSIITGAVIGIVIIFAAYAGVQFFMRSLGVSVGTSCGQNKIYVERDGKTECITECESQHPDWTCREVEGITGGTREEQESQVQAQGCEPNLCPGAVNNVCCPAGGGSVSGGSSDYSSYVGMYHDFCGRHPSDEYCGAPYSGMSDAELISYAEAHAAALYLHARRFCRDNPSESLCSMLE